MKVKDLCDEEKIGIHFIEKNFEGTYWESCADFVSQNWEREIDSLSAKQAAWFTKILDDCVEAKIEGEKQMEWD